MGGCQVDGGGGSERMLPYLQVTPPTPTHQRNETRQHLLTDGL